MLSLQGVQKSFAGAPVLRELTLTFRPRVVTAVVGASGCGKSTLLKLCNGLLRPDRGIVSAFAAPIDYQALPALRQRIGYAVQGSALFPHLDARGNITLAARLARWSASAIDERIGELLQLMHLEPELLTRYPHQLSGGQQQRVGLCRAMMLRPSVLLLDEPFAAIDPITRFEIHRQLLEVLAIEPATVVLVTHDMREAMRLAQQIVVMQAGEIRVDAPRAALLEGRGDLEPELLLQELMQAQVK